MSEFVGVHRIREDGIEEKWCSTCKCWKPISEFHVNRRVWDGLSSKCKVCGCAYQARYHQATRDCKGKRGPSITHVIKDGVEMKMCTKCMELRPLSEFGVKKAHWDGLQCVCLPCMRVVWRRKYRKKVLGF